VVYGGRVTAIGDYGIGGEIVTIVDSFDPFAEFGTPSDGTQGPTVHAGWGRALTGTELDYTASNLRPWAPAALHLGFFQTNLALDLIGATGCSLYTLPDVVVGVFAGPNGLASVELDLPASPMLHGRTFVTQMLAIDPGANALGVQTSNGIVTTVRHW
jgi:hypothetical protein